VLGIRFLVPDLQTASYPSIAIAGAAFFVLFRLGWGMLPTLAVCTGAGAVVFLLASRI
jgi:hypothetical protein